MRFVLGVRAAVLADQLARTRWLPGGATVSVQVWVSCSVASRVAAARVAERRQEDRPGPW
jgi:hypothetical protein